ncbi:hypothetical protein [Plasmodium yoelii yoelii]|nr:hypothetical protein [Plasmodium yoelii yoelii]
MQYRHFILIILN